MRKEPPFGLALVVLVPSVCFGCPHIGPEHADGLVTGIAHHVSSCIGGNDKGFRSFLVILHGSFPRIY